MDKIVKWQTTPAFKSQLKKQKPSFSRKNTAIASRPRLDVWIKGTKIEQLRKHKVLGLIFDTRMNWNEHILSTKQKNEHHQMLSPHQMGSRPRKPSHYSQNDNTKHLKIRRRGLRPASKAVLKKLEPTHNRGIRLALGVYAVCRTENALCEAGVSKLANI
jgi:hypothetical protein